MKRKMIFTLLITFIASVVMALGVTSAAQTDSVKFDFSADKAGWVRATTSVTLGHNGEAMTAAVTKKSQVIASPETSIDADTNRYMLVTMKNNINTSQMKLQFSYDGSSFVGSQVVTFSVNQDTEFVTYVVDMSANSNWNGTVKKVRLVLSDKDEEGTAYFKSIEFTSELPQEEIVYTTKFDFSADKAGWVNGVTSMSVGHNGEAMTVEVQKKDRILLSPEGANIDADANRYMIITMKNNINISAMKVRFNADGSKTFVVANTVKFNVNQDDDFATYVVDMGANANWAGTVKRMSIIFSDDVDEEKSGIAYFKSIEFVEEKPIEYITGFDFSEDNAGWKAGTFGVALSNSDGAMVASTVEDKANPIILSSEVKVDADTYKYMIITMKNTIDTAQMKIFFSETSAFSGDKLAKFNVKQDSDYATYVVDFSANSKWTGTIGFFRWDLTDDANTFKTGAAYIKSIEFAEEAPEVELVYITGFDFSEDNAGWKAGTFGVALSNSDGAMVASTVEDKANPIILSSEVKVDADTYKYMIITMKNTIDTAQMKIFFSETSAFSGDKLAKFNVKQDSDYATYVVDFSANSKWTGTIGFFRWDLTDDANTFKTGAAYIKSIEFAEEAPEVELVYITGFDFSEDSAGWYRGTFGAVLGHDGEAMTVSASTESPNPIILSSEVNIDADTYKYMVITMKNTIDTKQMRIFFSATAGGFTGAGDIVKFRVRQDTDYTAYLVNMSEASKWTGTIVQLRWDLTDDYENIKTGTAYIKSIQFYEEKPEVDEIYISDFDFSVGNDGWTRSTLGVIVGREGDAMTLTMSSEKTNPIISVADVCVDANKYKYMIITMKNTINTPVMKMFFSAVKDGYNGAGDHVIFNVNQDNDYTTYVLNMGSCAKWGGTIKHFRWVLVETSTGVYEGTAYVKSIEFVEEPPKEPIVGFDFATDSAGWYLGTYGAVIGRDEEAMAVSASDTAANPIILSSQVAIDAAANRYMVITMKNTVNTLKMTMFFSGTLNGFTGDGDFATFKVTQDGDYVTYVIDMSVCAKWQGTIVHFRWDLTDDPSKIKSGTAYVKSIEFVAQAPAGSNVQIPNLSDEITGSDKDEFDFTEDAYGWFAGSGVTMAQTTDGLNCEVTDYDCFIVSPEMAVSGTKRYMVITMKNSTETSAMQVMFARDFADNINGLNCVTFNVNVQDDNFTAYVIDLGMHGNWPIDGYLMRIRLDLNINETDTGTVIIKSIEFTDVKPEGFDDNKVTYDFTNSNAGFVNYNQVGVEIENGSNKFTITGDDPFIVSAYGLGVSAEYRYLRITMRAETTSWCMSVFFTTDTVTDFSVYALCYFDIENTDDFVTYVIDMSKCQTYVGTITMLRFDINDNDGGDGVVYIKSIEFAKESDPGYIVGGIDDDGNDTDDSTSAGDVTSSSDEGDYQDCFASIGIDMFAGLFAVVCAAAVLKKKKIS